MKKNLFILLITLALAGSAAAQSPKGAEQLRAKPAAKTESNVDGKLSILSSHIKSIGTIGRTSRYEIVSARVRGLDSPNISALLAYDSVTDTLAVLASGVEPGLGVAIVNGGAQVGSSFLFGSKLRPDRTSVNNNSDSDSDADAESEGSYSRSEGGSAISVSDADAKSSSASVAGASSTSSVKNRNSNTNVNANSNQQSQGQAQGQLQGQSNESKNHNKAPKAPKKSNKH